MTFNKSMFLNSPLGVGRSAKSGPVWPSSFRAPRRPDLYTPGPVLGGNNDIDDSSIGPSDDPKGERPFLLKFFQPIQQQLLTDCLGSWSLP